MKLIVVCLAVLAVDAISATSISGDGALGEVGGLTGSLSSPLNVLVDQVRSEIDELLATGGSAAGVILNLLHSVTVAVEKVKAEIKNKIFGDDLTSTLENIENALSDIIVTVGIILKNVENRDDLLGQIDGLVNNLLCTVQDLLNQVLAAVVELIDQVNAFVDETLAHLRVILKAVIQIVNDVLGGVLNKLDAIGLSGLLGSQQEVIVENLLTQVQDLDNQHNTDVQGALDSLIPSLSEIVTSFKGVLDNVGLDCSSEP